jgi:hypothetical protein
MRDRWLTGLDEKQILAAARAANRDLMRRLNDISF